MVRPSGCGARLLWAVALGVVLRVRGAGFEPAPATAPFGFHVGRYTTEQGLPQNSVKALVQTGDGYLWVGTLAGLARFDGVSFKVFNAGNTPELGSDAINALAEDRVDGSLWVSTSHGLLRYAQHRFERFGPSEGFPPPVGELWPARGSGIWYSPGWGRLALLQNRALQTWPVRRPVDLGHRICHVDEDEPGRLLVLMHMGLFRFVCATGALEPLGPPVGSDTSCRHFIKEADGTILLAAREGLFRLAAGRWERIEAVGPGELRNPARIHPTGDGELWIAWSDDGPARLARFRAGRSDFIDLSGLAGRPLTAFWPDREGHLWLGTATGLCQLRPNALRVYAREQGLRNDDVKSVTAGPDDTIWLGTADGASAILDGQVTNLPPVEPATRGARGEVLLADRHGRVWLGAYLAGTLIFERGQWRPGPEFDSQLGWLRTLYLDRQDRVWVGFERGAGWLGEDGVPHALPHPLPNPDVRVVHQDRRGDIWFGTYGGGLNRLRDGRIDTYATALGDYNNRAWWIHEDADGVFWVASQGGLNRFVPPAVPADTPEPPAHTPASPADPAGAFFTFTTRHGLRENTVNNIQEDDLGQLWLSGLQGIYCVSRRELNDVAAGRLPQVRVLAYGETDGLLSNECNGGDNQPAGCKDRAGRIWFPTVRGLAMVDPRAIRRNTVPPPVVIEQVKADGEPVYGDGTPDPATGRPIARPPPAAPLRLAPGRGRVLEIRYTGNSFAAPQRVRFKYRLENYDRDWHSDDGNRRVAFYTGLPPGAYDFIVTACNNHGLWSDTLARFAFAITPHFWQTRLFRVLAAAGLLGLAAGIQAYRLRWLRRLLRLEQQQALANERSRIARDLHDDLGTALTGLALRLDVLRRDAGTGSALSLSLAESAAGIRVLAEQMRQVVWAVNPRCDTVSSLASFLEQQAGHFLKADGLGCRFEFPEDIPPLPLDGETRYQLALGVREALTNAVRHAAATEIVLGLSVQADWLVLQVGDNGRGFRVADATASGHGLANLRARLAKTGGECLCRSAPGAGTTIELRVPLRAHRTRPSSPP